MDPHCQFGLDMRKNPMYRIIKFYIVKKGKIVDLTINVANILGYRYLYNKDGVVIRGCGMDMCFASVYKLADKVLGDGYKLITAYL